MKRIGWLVLTSIALGAQAFETVDLAGQWRFQRDDRLEGLTQKWFAGPLAGDAHIKLPGTMDEAKLGLPNPKKPALDGLYRPNVYEGAAWYQRAFEIPSSWNGKRVTLFLERVRWVTEVWLDGKPVGEPQDSLIAPHVYDCGTALAPGRHTLTIRLDNSVKIDLGTFVSVLFGGTPGNLNGMVGKLELRATDPVAIDDVQVYPDLERKLARVRATIINASGKRVDGALTVSAANRQSGVVVPNRVLAFEADPGRTNVVVELPMGDQVALWDEFSPALCELKVELSAGSAVKYRDRRAVTFGMRSFAARGTQFTLNGRPIFLRGTLECQVFPLTGYPPCDVPAWRRIFKIEKSYGLNFIRFHSCCPPEAAFAAADLEGILIQAEAPQANVEAGRDPRRDAFTEAELERIVRTYGNHPSFCLMTLGNEYGGKDAVLTHWVDMLIKEDPRHLYSSASAAQTTANRQWTESGSPRGVMGPDTEHDFRSYLQKEDRPLVGHEIGQWTFFPNFAEMKKYTGVMEPRNFEIVRDDMKSKGLLDLAPQYVQATGRHAILLYKEEIEVLMRTPGHPGFSLLDLHDYPGQGTALIGPLDPFWDSKGFIEPSEFKRFCGPTVPLLRLPKRVYTSDEILHATVDIAHFGPKDLAGAKPQWSIRNEHGRTIASGSGNSADIPTGKLSPLCAIQTPLAQAPTPCKLTLKVGLKGTPFANEWNIWIYPAQGAATPPPDVVVSREWDETTKTALAAGKKIVLFPSKKNLRGSLPGRFLPVFWSPVWFPSQKPNTMGILCDPRHPLFAQFPTDSYSDWQWWDLLQNSRSLVLDDTAASFRPLVQVIDNFARNHKLGIVFEARVGQGRLLVCTIDVERNLETRPAARQFARSLYAYLESKDFKPKHDLDPAALDKLFNPTSMSHGLMERGATVLHADSAAPDFEPANAIDGDANTIWHTPWDPAPAPLPHEIVIDLGKPIRLAGIKYLPRQDMSNGRIAEFEIYAGNDPDHWAAPVAQGRWPDAPDKQVVTFPQPVQARYLRLIAKSEVNGNAFIAVAELEVMEAKE